MSVVLLILAVLGGVMIMSAVLENTAPMTVTLLGQELTGLSAGEWLAAAAGLGALVMLLLWLAGTFSRRRRTRRHDIRAGKEELADRVADLERENYSLRESLASREEPTAEHEPARREPAVRGPVNREPVTREHAGREPDGHEPATREPDEREPDEREPVAPLRGDRERP